MAADVRHVEPVQAADEVDGEDTEDAEDAEAMTRAYIQCPQCAKRALSIATRCPQCGHELTSIQPTLEHSPADTRRRLVVPGIAAIAIIVVVLAVGTSGRLRKSPAQPGQPPMTRDTTDAPDTPAAARPASIGSKERRFARTWANVRTRRSARADVAGVLLPGDTIFVDSLERGWWRVTFEDSVLGYVHQSTVGKNSARSPSR